MRIVLIGKVVRFFFSGLFFSLYMYFYFSNVLQQTYVIFAIKTPYICKYVVRLSKIWFVLCVLIENWIKKRMGAILQIPICPFMAIELLNNPPNFLEPRRQCTGAPGLSFPS